MLSIAAKRIYKLEIFLFLQNGCQFEFESVTFVNFYELVRVEQIKINLRPKGVLTIKSWW